jgi:DNA-binding MarR family transcriptional regulator
VRLGNGNHYATLEQVQAVWMAVSLDGRRTIRDIVAITGVKLQKTNQILKFLEGCGYIEHQPGRTGRKAIIPLVHGEMVYRVEIKKIEQVTHGNDEPK